MRELRVRPPPPHAGPAVQLSCRFSPVHSPPVLSGPSCVPPAAPPLSSVGGIEIHADLHENMQQWLRSAGKQWPWLKHCTQLLEGNMINGDFTRDDRVSEVLKKADVVFVNNYLFDPQTGINPVVSRAPSLNQKLQALLCANLSSNATVLTTSKLTDSRRGGPPRGQVSQKRLLVTHKSFPLKPSDVSWGGKLRVYISSASTL